MLVNNKYRGDLIIFLESSENDVSPATFNQAFKNIGYTHETQKKYLHAFGDGHYLWFHILCYGCRQ